MSSYSYEFISFFYIEKNGSSPEISHLQTRMPDSTNKFEIQVI